MKKKWASNSMPPLFTTDNTVQENNWIDIQNLKKKKKDLFQLSVYFQIYYLTVKMETTWTASVYQVFNLFTTGIQFSCYKIIQK